MKITANIATYNNRDITATIKSLKDQVDEIHVYDNEKRLNLTDNGKFNRLDTLTEPEYYFTCDDDLIYPPDYVSKTIAAIEKYGCIITHHGRRLKNEGLKYYTGHEAYKCLDKVSPKMQDVKTREWIDVEAIEIDVAGTGVTAFRTDYFHPKGIANCPLQKMSDLLFSLEAAKQGKIIGLIGHDLGWFGHTDPQETIHKTETKSGTAVQDHLADLIFRLKHK